MSSERTSGTLTTTCSVVVILLSVTISVIFFRTIQDSDDKHTVEVPPVRDQPTKDKPTVSDHFAKPKPPSEHKSCVIFLNDVKSLTLDDFEPIDNQNNKELTLSQISQFNNLQLGPRIQSMARMDYFKFVKLNLHRGCSLWPDALKCVLKYDLLVVYSLFLVLFVQMFRHEFVDRY